jgi:hypothetical protein
MMLELTADWYCPHCQRYISKKSLAAEKAGFKCYIFNNKPGIRETLYLAKNYKPYYLMRLAYLARHREEKVIIAYDGIGSVVPKEIEELCDRVEFRMLDYPKERDATNEPCERPDDFDEEMRR